jgi:hypothetical protein
MKKCMFVVIVSLIGLMPLTADRIDTALDAEVVKIAAALPKKTVVSVGNIVYADKEIGSSFSNYIQEKLSTALQKNTKFEVFRKDKLDEILKEIKFGMTGLVEEGTAVEPGKLRGLQALFSGKFFDEGTNVVIYFDLVSVETGTVLTKSTVKISRNDIPASISILPENYNDAIALLKELTQVNNANASQFVVKAWPDRGKGATYKNGEDMVLNVYSNRDCYIKIYHIDAQKQLTLIFPNQWAGNNQIKKNTLYQIPDESYGFVWKMQPPFGTEFFKVVAQTEPFKDIEDSFEPLGDATKGLVTRGIGTQKRESQSAEVMTNYTIIE